MLTITTTILICFLNIISVDYGTHSVGIMSLSSFSSESAEVAAQASFVAYNG